MDPLIIGISIPLEIRKRLSQICYGLPNVEWVEEENFLLSICHIGKVEEQLKLDILENLAEIHFPIFPINLFGIECSKSKGLIWLNVEISDLIAQFGKEIERVLRSNKVEKKSQNYFFPHVILGRFRSISYERLCEYLESNGLVSVPSIKVMFFSLYECHTSKKRSFYTEISRYPLLT